MIQNPTLIGPQLPALTNPGTAADLAQGKELIGADGEVVTGAVNVVESGEFGVINSPLQHAPESTSVEPFAPGAPLFEVRGTSVSGSTIFRPGAVAKIYGRPKIFGDATAADVAKGKTFTSTAGVKVVGTAVIKNLPFAYEMGVLASGETATIFPKKKGWGGDKIASGVIVYRKSGEMARSWIVDINRYVPPNSDTSPDGALSIGIGNPAFFILRNMSSSVLEFVSFAFTE